MKNQEILHKSSSERSFTNWNSQLAKARWCHLPYEGWSI